MSVTMLYRCLSQLLVDTGYVAQEFVRSGIEIDTDSVDAGLHCCLQPLFQSLLIHVVLVLTYPDGFGMNLHQLGQWILKPPGDGGRSSDGEVQTRKFPASPFRRRVNGSSGLIHNDREDRISLQ